jgi:hypothetical protein
MSYHLQTDQRYLRQLATSTVDLFGGLGPAAQRNALSDALGTLAAQPLPERLQ